jgi:hypothetical protein
MGHAVATQKRAERQRVFELKNGDDQSTPQFGRSRDSSRPSGETLDGEIPNFARCSAAIISRKPLRRTPRGQYMAMFLAAWRPFLF